MKKPVHTLAAATVTAILSLSAATAQGNGVQGEVRRIDEAAGKVKQAAEKAVDSVKDAMKGKKK